MKINGEHIAQKIKDGLQAKPKPRKFLAAVLIGENKQSFGFLKKKEAVARELGVDFRIYQLPEGLNNDRARREVWSIAKHKTCGGVIVQLPLPEGLNKHYVINSIPREKDVEVFTERAFGAFCNNRSMILPPAVSTIDKILRETQFDISKKTAAVVGLGALVGKPAVIWLMKRARQIFLLRSSSDKSVLKEADLVILGTGNVSIVNPSMLKNGAGVIDFGYSTVDKKLRGDFDTSRTEELEQLAFYTPTPGGTGPILVTTLFENFYILNKD